MLLKSRCLLPLLLMMTACSPPQAAVDAQTDNAMRGQAADGEYMVSINVADAPPLPMPPRSDRWPDVEMDGEQIHVSCDTDYAKGGDGVLLAGLAREELEQALAPCADRGLVRVRYRGKINAVFVESMWRLSHVADALQIGRRVLDMDSSGGQVEAAIRAGDQIGESGWTMWVREGSVCHSACVFVLAAGDNRLLAGKVGIHRMMRISSRATSRAELNEELQQVYANVRDYLQRNGVAVGVADLMMTVPNRSLRLLTGEELRQYGLDGTNAVQDDLERIKQMRKCGQDFVRRKDSFLVAFDQRCKIAGNDLEMVTNCGQTLKERFGFPDATCPDESPLSEIDVASLLPPPGDELEQDAQQASSADADTDDASASAKGGPVSKDTAADRQRAPAH
jgi:hypothetical protein